MATNMFRLLSRQAFKAVSRPRLGLRLSNGTISHHVRTMQAPYSGPPSYDTIARRFSSDVVDPQAYFIRKRQQEAKDRGEYVDIHDIGGVDLEDFDVLISDVDDEKLRDEIAETVGIPYHAEAAKEDANKVVEIGDCYFYGRKLRMIFPAVVASKKGKAHWVFFIVDTSSPLTYLSAQTSALFGIKAGDFGLTPVKIAEHLHGVCRSPDNSHFAEVNIIGMDFCNMHDISQWNYFKNHRAKLYIGEKWKVVEKSKL